MEEMMMYLVSLLAVITVVIMLVKKMDIKITLFTVGLILMYIALVSGGEISLKGFESTGNIFIDPIQAIVSQFKSTLSGAGLIILVLGGYAAYMTSIGANDVTVNVLTKPLKGIKSPYVLVPAVFLLGNLLSLVIPSASNLAIILLATLYPILKKSGMSTLTAAGVIATTATIMPTPLGGDNVAIAEELAKLPQYADLTVSEYVFNYHALVSIPTLVVIAVVHYFWQKYMDKRDRLKGISHDNLELEVKSEKEITGGILYKTIYALLPVFPIILLLGIYALASFTTIDLSITVEVAALIGFIIAMICELIRQKDKTKVLKQTEDFFKGMGNSFGIVALLVAASVFVAGLKSIGLIAALQTAMVSMNGSGLGFVLPLILVLITAVIVFLSGSGVALFYAMVPMMSPLAEAAGISAFAVTIPMGLAGNLLRAVSPVSAVIVIVAASTKQNPLEVVKRTAVPMIVGTAIMFLISMLMFL